MGHKKPRGKSASPKKESGERPILWVVILAVSLLSYAIWPRRPLDRVPLANDPTPSDATGSRPDASGSRAEPPVTRPDIHKLEGRWLRTDGGYILEIRSVKSDGVCDAAYFNPRPIRVSRARVDADGASWKLFVELSDVGYPGSTYTLRYDPDTDSMSGVYYQAAQQLSFEVQFVRAE